MRLIQVIKNFIRGVVQLVLPKQSIKDAVKMDVCLSDTMVSKIDEWNKMYKGNASWVDDKSVISLHLEQGIVREFANVCLTEMETTVSNDSLNEIYQKVIRDLNENLQSGLALGSFIIKPLGDDKVQYVTADNFVPIAYDSRGRLVKVVFVDVHEVSDNEVYFRFEYHGLDKDGLTITNTAYRSDNKNQIGYQTTLDVVDDWANLPPIVNYPLMDKVDFGYFRTPIKNKIDDSFSGVSMYDSAIQLIKQADIQFGRLSWEFESGERAVNVDVTAIKSTTMIDGDGQEVVNKLNKRLYRGLNQEGLFEDYTPSIRDTNFINGLEEYKRNIEFNVGLSYGDISNPNTVDKTATEIMASKKRKYNTVNAIQNNLKDALDDLVNGLAFYNGLMNTGYEFECDFKDSILTDEDSERSQDRMDVSMGVMSLAEYRSKWYGEPIEQAQANLPVVADLVE